MTITNKPAFVQKMLDEFSPDFFGFLEDFTKDLLNKIPELPNGEPEAIASGLIIRFMAVGIALSLLDLDARQLNESLSSLCHCVKREHSKFKAQYGRNP